MAAVINPPDTSNNNNAGDEWTRFLNKVSTVQATTYTLEVGPSTTGQGPYNTSLLQSMGRQGKGGYFSATDTATLNAALTRIFNDIQAVNSVFASSSLPLSADNSGAYSDQVYMGVFRPDGQGLPKWLGNLKQYKFAVDNNNKLFLVDAKGVAAAGVKGFATPDAESFWTSKDTTRAPDATAAPATSTTTGSTGGFYFFDAKGSGLSYDLPDGEWVEKGGAAQQLRLAYLGYGVGSPSRGGIGDNNDSTLNSLARAQDLYVHRYLPDQWGSAGSVLESRDDLVRNRQYHDRFRRARPDDIGHREFDLQQRPTGFEAGHRAVDHDDCSREREQQGCDSHHRGGARFQQR